MTTTVTVLLPLSGTTSYFRKSLDSLLTQTFEDFKLLVLAIEGKDKDEKLILSTLKDPRIHLIEYPNDVSKADILNSAIASCDSSYLIMAGSSDIATPNRIDTQISFLEKNSDVSACGSAVFFGDEMQSVSFPSEYVDIQCRMFFTSAMASNSLAFRTELFKSGGYRFRNTYPGFEFYNLLYSLSQNTVVANIQEVLVYSYDNEEFSRDNTKIYRAGLRSFFVEKLTKIGIRPTPQELKIQVDIYNMKMISKVSNPLRYKVWLAKLVEVNNTLNLYPQKNFEQEAAYQWRNLYRYMFRYSTRRALQYLKADGKSDTGIWLKIIKSYISGRR